MTAHGARRARARALARDRLPVETAIVERVQALETVRRVHRDLVTLVDKRARVNANESHRAARYDRRINDLATTLVKKPSHRMALGPAGRRFAPYARARSERALARERDGRRRAR